MEKRVTCFRSMECSTIATGEGYVHVGGAVSSVNGGGVRPLQVMVVEDEAIIRTFISFALRSYGCQVVSEVAYGEEAVEAARANSFDIIIMDIRLKGEMDGIQAARTITTFNTAKIVFMSAYDREKVGVDDEFPNMVGYLVKPVHSADIQQVVFEVQQQLISGTGG